MQQMKREGPSPAALSALPDMVLRRAAGERGAATGTREAGTTRWRAEERQRYIAERARALALGVDEHERRSLMEEQLRIEIAARLEQLDEEIHSRCADAGPAEPGGDVPPRRLPLQLLLAATQAEQVRQSLEHHEATRDGPPSSERLQALEQHAEVLTLALERLAASARSYSMRSERSNSSGFEEA